MRPLAAALVLAAALRLPEPASVVTLVQRDALRTNGDVPSASVSADGRYVAFTSYAQLVPADVNGIRDVYVLDRAEGRVTLESIGPGGAPSIHDSTHGTMRVVSTGRRGAPAHGWSGTPAVSESGRFVAFASTATELVPEPDANGSGLDVYLFDAVAASLRRVSVDTRATQPSSGFSARPSMSADGRYVTFVSSAPLVADATPEQRPLSQVYLRDAQLATTRRVSVAPGGRPADGPSWSPVISADGRYVAFVSGAANLVPDDRNGSADVFVADLHTGVTELVSRSIRSGTANGPSSGPAISSDGRFIALQSEASDLVCARRCPAEAEDINLLPDVFLLDRRTGVMARLSADGTGGWMEASSGPSIDASGTVVTFSSRRPIDASDQSHDFDLFVRRIGPALTARSGR